MNEPQFTGERFVPGQGGARIAYEHLHRYLYAARWAGGNRVLDVASGSGYGAEILAREAKQVWAVDIDAGTLAHARTRCARPNLGFIQADASRLPLKPASVDLIVAMEVLEHVARQKELVDELARVVSPDGVVRRATPNKSTYSDARSYSNPFHVHEFYRDEFLALLQERFRCVHLLDQQIRAGSLITGDAEGSEVLISGPAAEQTITTAPMYFLALCSRGNLQLVPPGRSAFVDLADALLDESAREIARLNEEIRNLGDWGGRLCGEIEEKDETLRGIVKSLAQADAEIAARDSTIRQVREELETEVARRDEVIRRLQNEFEERSRWAQQLTTDVSDRDERLRQTNEALDRTDAELHKVSDHLARIRHAFLYRVLCRLGILPK